MIRDLYLPAAVANGIAGAFCVVACLMVDRPLLAAIGAAVSLAAVLFVVTIGEVFGR